jgi:hypothetical protein
MRCCRILGRRKVTVAVVLTLLGFSAGSAFAQSAVKLKGEGTIHLSTSGPSPFVLSGTASHLGQCTCNGEINLVPGQNQGSLDGVGVAVFQAANGDLLVGVVTYHTEADGGGQIAFSWRDSVEFSDGRTVFSTGRFATSRPPGIVSPIKTQLLVVIAIIAILIG